MSPTRPPSPATGWRLAFLGSGRTRRRRDGGRSANPEQWHRSPAGNSRPADCRDRPRRSPRHCRANPNGRHPRCGHPRAGCHGMHHGTCSQRQPERSCQGRTGRDDSGNHRLAAVAAAAETDRPNGDGGSGHGPHGTIIRFRADTQMDRPMWRRRECTFNRVLGLGRHQGEEVASAGADADSGQRRTVPNETGCAASASGPTRAQALIQPSTPRGGQVPRPTAGPNKQGLASALGDSSGQRPPPVPPRSIG